MGFRQSNQSKLLCPSYRDWVWPLKAESIPLRSYMLLFLHLCTSTRVLVHFSLNPYFGFRHHLSIPCHLLPLISVSHAWMWTIYDIETVYCRIKLSQYLRQQFESWSGRWTSVLLMLGLGVTNYLLFIESGNMLIMTYAYARASGDGSLISRYVRQGFYFFSDRPHR